ncbi:MAG TPA: class I SAM-dependent methyltransferase [Candidatus Saccharimonadales bacterium]
MAKAISKSAKPAKPIRPARHKADQYNDPTYDYRKYWEGREYENAAEEIAIRRLLGERHFHKAVDIGGGYGRLCILLEQFADKVVLTDPSQQQLDIARDFLKDHPKIDRQLMTADDLKFKDGSVDLVTIVRILHHIPDPTDSFTEIARVLSDDGYFVMEFANYAHARNRIKHWLKGRRMPLKPVDIRSEANQRKDEIPFVNHNPKTVIRQLQLAGLEVERSLSVSNLRSPRIKELIPLKAMLFVENVLQRPLAPFYFGPSVFFLVRKAR